jgi:hypothetical protein
MVLLSCAFQQIKGSGRFKERGLQNEDQLEIMFENLHNTGDDHWSAGSSVAPSQSSDNSAIDLDAEDDPDNSDSESEEWTPTTEQNKRAERVNVNNKGKKPKTHVGHWFQEQMALLVQQSERTTTSAESIARREDKSGCFIQDVMKLVKECGAISGTNDHFVASLVLVKRDEREMFMTLETPEERFAWLRRKHEWMTRNDVAK